MTAGHSAHTSRLDRLRSAVAEAGVDTVVVVDPASVLYFTGYWTILTNSSPQALVVSSAGVELVIPALETQVAGSLPMTDLKVTPYRNYPLTMHGLLEPAHPFVEALEGVLRRHGGRAVGTERDAARATAYGTMQDLATNEVVDCGPLIRRLRANKDAFEVQQIRRAAAIASEAMNRARGRCAPGVSEVELAGEIASVIWSMGARATHIVIGTAERGATAHALPTARKIDEGTPTVFDIGVLYEGYWAEIARTVVTADPQKPFTLWHAAVVDGLEAARERLAPGVSAGEVDAAARNVLARHGFGSERFNHAAGHGVGLLGMDAPLIGPNSRDVLPETAAVTLEPGIYFPGVGGLRIEETLLVSSKGVEILTSSASTALAN